MSAAIDLAQVALSGAWLIDAAGLDSFERAAHAAGLEVRCVDLAGCRSKAELLRRVAVAFEFPATFGANWDALADCMRDLAWLPDAAGRVWLFAHADDLHSASAIVFDTFCVVLDDACRDWMRRGTPCFALMALPGFAPPVRAPR